MSSTPPVNPPANRRAAAAAANEDRAAANGRSHGHAPAELRAPAEHRAPERIAPHGIDGDGEDQSYADDMTEESGEGEATADEILRETERWAPTTLRDTVAEPEQPTTTGPKICRGCGRDLRGHRRLKDDQGYICVSCAKDEAKRKIACAECGKPTKPEGLRPWGPISVCARCWMDHQADPKSRVRRQVSSRPWEEAEKRTVLYMTGGTIALILIILIISAIAGC